MYTYRVRLKTVILGSLFTILLATSACTLPFWPTSPTEPESSETVDLTAPTDTGQPADTTPAPDIPAAILTEVAATIRAQIPQQPGAPPSSDATGAPPANAPQAPVPLITSTPTQTNADFLAPQNTSTPTLTPSPTLSPIVTIIIIQPPIGGAIDSGIKVRGLNIHWCGGQPWAIFRILNRSSFALESMSLLYQDLSTSQTLSGPFISNAPFVTTDKTCISSGLGSLAPGRTLYLGNSLGSSGLQGHRIQTTITLCTGDGLGGTCYQKVVEFVMP